MEKYHYFMLLSLVLILLTGTEIARQLVLAEMESEVTSPVVLYDSNEEGQLVIPVVVHLIEEPSGRYSTIRDTQNVIAHFGLVNQIWQQANISFATERVVRDEVHPTTVPRVLNKQTELLSDLASFDEDRFNVYFTDNIRANGIAFLRDSIILVADKTSVNDYRTTAHELGHVLGLHHISDRSRLMFSGSNGIRLTAEEIQIARSHAVLLDS